MLGKQRVWCMIGRSSLGHKPGDEPLTLMRCHTCGLRQLYETLRAGGLSVAKAAT